MLGWRGPCPLRLEAEVFGSMMAELEGSAPNLCAGHAIVRDKGLSHGDHNNQAGRDAGIIWPKHSTHMETEGQRDRGICPRSHGRSVTELRPMLSVITPGSEFF